MTIALALLLGSLLVASYGHRPLLRLAGSTVDPRVGIVAWLVALASVFATSIVGILVLGLPGHGGIPAVLASVSSCWSILGHGALPGWEDASAALGALALSAIVGRLAWVGVRQTRIRRQRRERYRFLVSLADGSQTAGSNVVWLDHPNPVAFSVAGRPGLVAVSHGVRDILRPTALAATLEHEQAHLRGHHHLLLDLVDATAAALPAAPLFREAPRAMRCLVELAADVAAVRRCGVTAVADALQVLSTVPPAAEGIAMANTAIDQRLSRLQAGPVRHGPVLRAFSCGVAACVVALAPGALGVLLLTSVACSVG